MTQNKVDFTYIPWINAKTSGYVVLACIAVFVAFCIFRVLMISFNKSMRVGTFSIIQAYIVCFFINVIIYDLLFWYYAIIVAALFSAVFMIIVHKSLKYADIDEKNGQWGLNKKLRRIRGEIFHDLSIKEQKEYKENIKRIRFSYIIFFIVTAILPFLVFIILKYMGFSYIFVPQAK